MEYRALGGLTPLLYASVVFGTQTTIWLRLLISYGADIHATNDQGLGAIHMILMSLHISLYSAPFNGTPLASWWPYLDESCSKLDALLKAGCDPNATDLQGRTPAQCVAHNGVAHSFWMTVVEKNTNPVLAETETETETETLVFAAQ
jgi:ankyrin repeat protein